MNLLSIDELRTLAEQPKGLCVSIYMPTYKAGPEVRQNEIRFKNLVRSAEHQLVENGLTETEAKELFQPLLEAFDQEADFWEQKQDEGLALFVTAGFFRYYRLPRNFAELVVVTSQFHLKPLLPILTDNGKFYILELSQKEVRLFEGDRYSIHEIEIMGLPQNMNDALQYDPTAREGQIRSGTAPGGSSQQAGAFHGQGSPDRDDNTQDLKQFFHLIDHALHEFLRDKRAPLILACVEYLMPVYREANTYAHLLEEGITGNVKIEKLQELHQQGWEIVEPYVMQARQAAIEHYQELSDTDKISTDIKETVPAAFYGRVEQLFVAVGVQRWGTFDPIENEIQVHANAEPGDEDLLDAAAIQTLLNGGTVYAVEPEVVPDDAPLAAVFRY